VCNAYLVQLICHQEFNTSKTQVILVHTRRDLSHYRQAKLLLARRFIHKRFQGRTTPPHRNRFTALFPEPPGWASARRELLDFMMQGKINRGRHTDHLAGRHSIRTYQCPPPPHHPQFLQAGCPSCRQTNSVKALKATSTPKGYKGIYTSQIAKMWLNNWCRICCWFRKCQHALVNIQQCSSCITRVCYLHNDNFLTDIIGYDRLKLSSIYTPKMKSWERHWMYCILCQKSDFGYSPRHMVMPWNNTVNVDSCVGIESNAKDSLQRHVHIHQSIRSPF